MQRFLSSDARRANKAAGYSGAQSEMMERNRHDGVTLVAIAVLAFIAACVAHEAIGHGGMCIAIGAHVTMLTSVYFHCSNGGPLTDAAGPGMNLIVGAVCWYALKSWSMPSPQWRLFLVFTMAFNLFWGAGYFVFSAITDTGDWAFVLRDLALTPRPLWLFLMSALGVYLYYRSTQLVASQLPPGIPLLTAYLAAGAVSCIAALFFSGPVLPALGEAALESFGAAVGLLWLARRTSRQVVPAAAETIVARGTGWIFAAALAMPVFVATLGRGLP